MTKRERKRRRKRRLPTSLYLGHIVKNCMTVIVSMGSYQRMQEVYAEVYADHLTRSVFYVIGNSYHTKSLCARKYKVVSYPCDSFVAQNVQSTFYIKPTDTLRKLF